MAQSIRIGLIGCGVVGTGILRLLRDHAGSIESRLGAPLDIRRIVVRDASSARDEVVPRNLLSTDAQALLDDSEIDIVVEVMGGVSRAGELVRAALERGKHVVTANKALLAEQGDELVTLAEARSVDLYFEAAVAGGIPIIRVLREALASDQVVALRGIVNGTSNYILSRMQSEGSSFEDALREAQAAGYAEADPTLDVNGGDACHKLAILATLAFGARVQPTDVPTEGIESITAGDIEFAKRFGFVIKPLAVARQVLGASSPEQHSTKLDLRVHPALVPQDSVLASIPGAINAVHIEGAMLGPCVLSGPGAGALPTAMSVVSDIVDVGRNLLIGAHGRVPSRAFRGDRLKTIPIQDAGDHRSRFYLRTMVRDEPGVLAAIANVLGKNHVSIEQMFQDGSDTPVAVVMLTHEARERDVTAALKQIDALANVVSAAQAIRVEH